MQLRREEKQKPAPSNSLCLKKCKYHEDEVGLIPKKQHKFDLILMGYVSEGIGIGFKNQPRPSRLGLDGCRFESPPNPPTWPIPMILVH